MKSRWFSLLIALVLVLVAPMALAAKGGASNKTRQDKSAQAFRVKTYDYNIAKATYKTTTGAEMPYHIRGYLALPDKGDNLPLVIILHGSHDNEHLGTKLYKGFEYLADALAKSGFAAVSMDIQSAYVWQYGDNDDSVKIPYLVDRQLSYFQKAVGDEKTFPTDLTGRLDLNKVIVIGHSRGGNSALDIAGQLPGVMGVLAVAPASDSYEKAWKDIPIAVLSAEYDGDVTEYSAYHYWPYIKEAGLNSLFAATLVKGANHNGFNSMLKQDDATLNYDKALMTNRLTAKEQRAFLSQYAAAFCRYALTGDAAGTLFDLTQGAPDQLYGAKVKTLYDNKHFMPLADMTLAPETQGAAAKPVVESNFYKDDTTPGFNFPSDGINLWNVTWDQKGGSVRVPVSGGLEGFQGLAINLAVDPSDVRNGGKPQSFSVVFSDGNGDKSTVVLPGSTTALECVPGKNVETEIDGKMYYSWKIYTPPSAILIPFTQLEGMEPSSVRMVTLQFDQTESGGIMFSGIYGY